MLTTPPPHSAEVENEYELYLLSPQAPPGHGAGLLYSYLSILMEAMGRPQSGYAVPKIGKKVIKRRRETRKVKIRK
jgi:hypothetical protein